MTDAFFDAVDTVLDENLAKKSRSEATLTDAQKYIDFGNKVFLLTPSVAKQDMVVGRIVEPEDWDDLRALVAHLAMPGGMNQPLPSNEELRQKHEEGYRLGLFFGEDYDLGYAASYHISRLYPITDTEFDGIRAAKCDPNEAAKHPWFGELEDNIISAVEAHPDSPYRKQCENPACGSKRVMLAEYYMARNLSPIALQMNVVNQNMDVLTCHAVSQDVVEPDKRVFRCLACEWESEPLSQEQYREVHKCNHGQASALEVLFDVSRFVI